MAKLIQRGALAGVLGAVAWAAAALAEPGGLAERLAQLDQLEPSDWGIRNGCLMLSRVRSMQFTDDQTAILELPAGKQAVLRLAKPCAGVARNGYLLINRDGRLCARFDAVAAIDNGFGGMRGGMRCQIESIQPHLGLERE